MPEEISEAAIKRSRVVHASTFALSRQPCRDAVIRAFQLAQEADKLISLDPNYSPRVWPDQREALAVLEPLFGLVTLTKPSLDDARRLFGEGQSPESYIDRFHQLGPELVVLTMGKDGVIVSVDGKKIAIPARPVKVVDATGAGDSFWAGYLVSLLDHGDPLFSAHVAQAVVARKLEQVGPLANMLDRQEMYDLAASHF
jgi:fructokinase